MKAVRLPCYCGSLRQATRVITQWYDECLKPAEITITQFGILKMLAACPDSSGGDLADAFVMDSTTLTRTLAGLKKRGWVMHVPGADRREKHWRLLPEGKDKLTEATPYWEQAQARLQQQAPTVNFDLLSDISFALVDTFR